jgi:hypothetical protein
MSLPWHLIGQALSAAPRVGPSRSLGHSELVAGATKCVIIVCRAGIRLHSHIWSLTWEDYAAGSGSRNHECPGRLVGQVEGD